MQQLFRICCDHLSASYLSAQLGELLQCLLDSCVSLLVGKSTVVRTHYNAECGGLLAVGYLLALVDIKELYAFEYLANALGNCLFKVSNGDILIAYNCKVTGGSGVLGQGLIYLFSFAAYALTPMP